MNQNTILDRPCTAEQTSEQEAYLNWADNLVHDEDFENDGFEQWLAVAWGEDHPYFGSYLATHLFRKNVPF